MLCETCARPFTADEPAYLAAEYRRSPDRRVITLCGACGKGWPARDFRRVADARCAHCDRPIHFGGGVNRDQTHCSAQCRRDARNQRRRRARTTAELVCQHAACGQTFTSHRGHARYCSSACRQAAYRARMLPGGSAREHSSPTPQVMHIRVVRPPQPEPTRQTRMVRFLAPTPRADEEPLTRERLAEIRAEAHRAAERGMAIRRHDREVRKKERELRRGRPG